MFEERNSEVEHASRATEVPIPWEMDKTWVSDPEDSVRAMCELFTSVGPLRKVCVRHSLVHGDVGGAIE